MNPEHSQPNSAPKPPPEGQRLDAFVAQWLSLSRNQVRTLLSLKAIMVNHKPCKAKGHLLLPSDEVAVIPDAIARLTCIEPNPNLEIPLLYKDPTLVVVNKPAGMAVHPLHPEQNQTVLNGLVAQFPTLAGKLPRESTGDKKLSGLPPELPGKLPGAGGLPGVVPGVGEGGLRCGVVHRLDVQTSGVLAVALTEASWQSWRKAFSEHQVTKLYHALVAGHPCAKGQATMRLSIGQHRPARVRVVETSQGYPCHLSWRVLETYEEASWVEINLGTGFLHQIRVMFAHLGHPVLGDPLYTSAETSLPFSGIRQMLHAFMLKRDDLEIQCAVPVDFEQVRQALRDRP